MLNRGAGPAASLADRTWLILGGSSAIARAFARAVAERGAAVILAGRDLDDLAITAADCRVRGAAAAEAARFDATVRADQLALAERCAALPAGALDVLLAFGLMPAQSAMERDPLLALAAIDATYSGAVEVLLRLAPVLEAGGAGRVVVLSSVAGDRGRLKNYVYGSAKAGLSAFAAGLRNRLFRAGVTVTTVKPGFLDTQMTWGLPGIILAASPEATAAAILKAALKGRETVYTPAFWAMIMAVIRLIPEPIFKRLKL